MRNGFMPGEWDLPPEYGPVMQDTSRQMKLADLLRQQSMDMPQGQMVSGHYVAPSITQYMAQMLKGYNAGKMEDAAYKKQQGAYEDYKAKKATAAQDLAEALKPKTVEQPVDYSDAGGMPGMVEQVQQQPDFGAAMAKYLQTGYADPAMVAFMQGEHNYQRGRQDKLEDRDYTERLEDKRYTRSRQDTLQDKEADQKFQRIMLDLQQGFQVSMKDKEFAHQYSILKQQQAFQTGERVAGQNFQAGENAKTRAAAREEKKANGPDWKYDAGSDTWVAPPDANNPNGYRLANQEKQNAFRSMEVVMKQFEGEVDDTGKLVPGTGAIGKTPQGGWMGISGKAGFVTNYQQNKRFNNLREQLSTELRTLFRIPGEGALSDKEQAQYGVQLPSTDYDEETNRQILADIRARVQARLGGGKQTIMPKNEQMPKNNQPTVVDW